MPQRELSELLEQLEKELESSRDLSEEERAALGELRHRIGDMLGPAPPQPSGEGESLIDPLRDYLDRLETSHPTITMIVGRIADALNKMGI